MMEGELTMRHFDRALRVSSQVAPWCFCVTFVFLKNQKSLWLKDASKLFKSKYL